jgi:putative oxidoreductase
VLLTFGNLIAMFARIIVGATLLVAGVGKIRNGRSKFLRSILGYDLVPDRIAAFMAVWLPYLEFLAGGMLLLGIFSQGVSVFAFAILLIFTGAITISLVRGLNNDCGCFRHVTPVQWRLVFRDVFLMGLILPVFAFKGGNFKFDAFMPVSTSLDPAGSIRGLLILTVVWGAALISAVLVNRLIRRRGVHLEAAPY